MEIIFIRHGQGQHNLDVPDRLNIENPHLTDKGKTQVGLLHSVFTFVNADLFIVSPTIRTIETANIITERLDNAQKYISPLVGPRMFPLPANPEKYEVKCDIHYPLEKIQKDHADFIALHKEDEVLWEKGINALDDTRLYELGKRMVDWIKSRGVDRAFIIAHDGTITCYRQLLGEEGLTRSDFLGEAGWHRAEL
jgi:broad specificity phosphatase PhoE